MSFTITRPRFSQALLLIDLDETDRTVGRAYVEGGRTFTDPTDQMTAIMARYRHFGPQIDPTIARR